MAADTLNWTQIWTYDLHGHPVTRVWMGGPGGRFAWAGERVALAIGYRNSSGLSAIMAGRTGEHFDMLAGADSAQLATIMRGQEANARRLLVFYAAGLVQAQRNLLAKGRTEKARLLAEVLAEAGVTVGSLPAPELPAPTPEPAAESRAIIRVASADDLSDAMRASFERHPLTVLTFRDRPAFIGTEVAQVLDYAPEDFAKRLRDWADESGAGLVKGEGEDLAALKAMLGAV